MDRIRRIAIVGDTPLAYLAAHTLETQAAPELQHGLRIQLFSSPDHLPSHGTGSPPELLPEHPETPPSPTVSPPESQHLDADATVPAPSAPGEAPARETMAVSPEFKRLFQQQQIGGDPLARLKPVWTYRERLAPWFDTALSVPYDLVRYPLSSPVSYQIAELAAWADQDTPLTTHGDRLARAEVAPMFETEDGLSAPYEYTGFHLDRDRFCSYLAESLAETDVEEITTPVTNLSTDFTADSQPAITGLDTETSHYRADLYLDATGRSRRLLGPLEPEFSRLSSPINRVARVTHQTEYDAVSPETLTQSAPAGWVQQTTTTDRQTYTYFYNAAHTTPAAVVNTLDTVSSAPVDPHAVAIQPYHPVTADTPWVGNCLGVGKTAFAPTPLRTGQYTIAAKSLIRLARLLSIHQGALSPAIRQWYTTDTTSAFTLFANYLAAHYAGVTNTDTTPSTHPPELTFAGTERTDLPTPPPPTPKFETAVEAVASASTAARRQDPALNVYQTHGLVNADLFAEKLPDQLAPAYTYAAWTYEQLPVDTAYPEPAALWNGPVPFDVEEQVANAEDGSQPPNAYVTYPELYLHQASSV